MSLIKKALREAQAERKRRQLGAQQFRINLAPGARPWWNKSIGRKPKEKASKFLKAEHLKELKTAFSYPFVMIRGLVTTLADMISDIRSKLHPLRAGHLLALRAQRRLKRVRMPAFTKDPGNRRKALIGLAAVAGLALVVWLIRWTGYPSMVVGFVVAGVIASYLHLSATGKSLSRGKKVGGWALVASAIIAGIVISSLGTTPSNKSAKPTPTVAKQTPKAPPRNVAQAPKGSLPTDTALPNKGVTTPAPTTAPTSQQVAQGPQPAPTAAPSPAPAPAASKPAAQSLAELASVLDSAIVRPSEKPVRMKLVTVDGEPVYLVSKMPTKRTLITIRKGQAAGIYLSQADSLYWHTYQTGLSSRDVTRYKVGEIRLNTYDRISYFETRPGVDSVTVLLIPSSLVQK